MARSCKSAFSFLKPDDRFKAVSKGHQFAWKHSRRVKSFRNTICKCNLLLTLLNHRAFVKKCNVPNSPFGLNTHTDSLNVYLLLHFQKHVLTNRLIVIISAFFAAKTQNICYRLSNDDSVIRSGIWSHEKSENLNTRKTWPEPKNKYKYSDRSNLNSKFTSHVHLSVHYNEVNNNKIRDFGELLGKISRDSCSVYPINFIKRATTFFSKQSI